MTNSKENDKFDLRVKGLNIKITRIKKMITNRRSSWLLYKFSSSTPHDMYREQNGECAYWCKGVKGISFTDLSPFWENLLICELLSPVSYISLSNLAPLSEDPLEAQDKWQSNLWCEPYAVQDPQDLSLHLGSCEMS